MAHTIIPDRINRATRKRNKMSDSAVGSAVANVGQSAEAQLANVTQGAGFYTSLALSTPQDKLAFLGLVTNSTPINDKVGEDIAIKDVVIQTAEFVDEESGAITEGLRTTIIDADGNAYHASSKGIALALRTAFNVMGEPSTWAEPLVGKVRQVTKGRNRILTLTF